MFVDLRLVKAEGQERAGVLAQARHHSLTAHSARPRRYCLQMIKPSPRQKVRLGQGWKGASLVCTVFSHLYRRW